MTKGRKPIPSQLKKLRGTDQPCRTKNELEPEVVENVDSIKSAKQLTLLKTRRAKDIFKQKANQLLNLKILTELDYEQLAIYANSLDMLFTCIAELKKGHYEEIHDEHGNLLRYVENPYLKLYKDMTTLCNKMAGDFGFTPISRIKFNIEPDDKPDFLKQFS